MCKIGLALWGGGGGGVGVEAKRSQALHTEQRATLVSGGWSYSGCTGRNRLQAPRMRNGGPEQDPHGFQSRTAEQVG